MSLGLSANGRLALSTYLAGQYYISFVCNGPNTIQFAKIHLVLVGYMLSSPGAL